MGARPQRSIALGVGLSLVLAGFLALLALRGGSVRFGRFHDDAIYMVAGQAMAADGSLTLPSLPGAPDQTKYPPGYPALLALVWRIQPSFPANVSLATALSALFAAGALTVAFLHLRRWQGVGSAVALAAVAWSACQETLLLVSAAALSEAPFVFLALTALWLADSDKPRGPYAAAAAVGLAILTRSVGVAVAAGIALGYLWRRDLPALARFSAGTAPFALALFAVKARLSPTVPADAPEGYRQTLLYYLDYVGFWRLSVPDWETLLGLLSRNLASLAEAPAALTAGSAPEGALGALGWIVLSAAIVSGLIRQARADRWRATHWALALHLPIVVLWNYEIADRLLLLFLPYFAVGLWLEGRHGFEGFRRTVKASGPAADRAISAVALALLLAVGAYLAQRTATTQLDAIRRPAASYQEKYREIHAWVREAASPDARFIAIDDAFLYLHTGRQAIWPLALTTEPRFRPDRERLERQMERLPDVAGHIDADFLLVG